eukprot:TRINITY_DN10749_c0_g1_i2.p1 TRINITY_DN10749_c0_g1~~TRINITY_DN10749_c0_g1_i2.p1  ORF type:complete len:306 (-),score=64.28 TRINITY_DN10749_c0_g1_i2:77-994(-)
MTASLSNSSVLSGLTLALLESSGWYQVDKSNAQLLSAGSRQGCRFLESHCIQNGKVILEGFCSQQDPEGCTLNHLAKGFCPEKEDPSKGFYDPFTDDCPYKVPFDGKAECQMNENRNPALADSYDEDFGPRSRCFEGDYLKKGRRGEYKGKTHGACHNFECRRDEARREFVIINVGKTSVRCPPEGGFVSIPNYVGKIKCPRGDLFCPTEFINECALHNYCGGVGKCFAGRCYCPRPRVGTDCSEPKPLNCSGEKCNGKGVCKDGVCKCNEGWGGQKCDSPIFQASCSRCQNGNCMGDECNTLTI